MVRLYATPTNKLLGNGSVVLPVPPGKKFTGTGQPRAAISVKVAVPLKSIFVSAL